MSYNTSYTTTEITDKNGRKREINMPNPTLKAKQRAWLNRLKNNPHFLASSHSFAYREGLTNPCYQMVKAHSREGFRVFILCFDLKNFFRSVKENTVYQMVKGSGYSSEQARIVTALSCYNGSLAFGSPLSPILANLYLKPFDYEVANVAENYGLIYTRYSDDLFLSAVNYGLPESYYFQHLIEGLKYSSIFANMYGLKINLEKIRFNPNSILGIDVAQLFGYNQDSSLTDIPF